MSDFKYRYMLAIAEQKSFSKAAEVLFVSQPYLSKVVTTVERELGTQLFCRDHIPLTVTAAGECYLDFIRGVLYSERQMYSKMNDIAASSCGKIRFGIGTTHGSYILPALLKEFAETFPRITVAVEEVNNKNMIERTENGMLDLCMFAIPEIPDSLDYTLLKKEHLLLVLPPNHPLRCKQSKGNFVSPPSLRGSELASLANDKFIFLTEHQGIGMFTRLLFKKYDFSPEALFETRNVETAYRLAAAGLGDTIIPQSCTGFSRFDDPPNYFLIDDPPLTRDIVVVYKKGRVLSAAETALCETAMKLV